MRAVVLLLVAGCAGSDALAIEAVDPPSGPNTVAVPVQIAGTNFVLPIRSNVDTGKNSVGAMTVRVGDTPLTGLVWHDEQRLEGTVPAGLAIGTYDVTVELGALTGVLPAGYSVTSLRVQPPAGPCGGPGTLADDFSDGRPAAYWRVETPGDVVERNGTLDVTPTTTGMSGYRSDPYVDMTDADADVEVRRVPDAGTGGTALFRFSHGADWFGFSVADGMLHLEISGKIADVPYDPTAHRFWRASHSGSTLVLSTSYDGNTWSPQLSAAPPAWLRYVSISVGAANPASAPSPGTASFAELATYVAPSQWCDVDSFRDDFNDAQIGMGWVYHGRSSMGCSELETSGAARVDQNGTQACDAYFGTSALYNLETAEMEVRITAITNYTAGWITYFGVWDLAGNNVRLYFEQNEFCTDGTGVAKVCVPYNTSEDLWRFREDASTLYIESAASTSTNWRLLRQLPRPFPMTAIRPRFGTLTDRAINTSIGLSVDRYN